MRSSRLWMGKLLVIGIDLAYWKSVDAFRLAYHNFSRFLGPQSSNVSL